MISIHRRQTGHVWYVVAVDENGTIIGSSFSTASETEALKRALGKMPLNVPFTERRADGYARRVFEVLEDLHEGKRTVFDFKLALDALSAFSRRVLEAVSSVPHGYVTTYADVAGALSNARAARAVGRAMAANPFPLLIPCHRVVRSNLEVGGYFLGEEVKRRILEREGVIFRDKQIYEKHLWRFGK